MRRTTSLTEVAPPSVLAVVLEDEDEDEQAKTVVQAEEGGAAGGQDWLAALGVGSGAPGTDWLAAYRARAAPARAGLRRNSADYSKVETAAFLRHCGLCRRLLGPGRDTFMQLRSQPSSTSRAIFRATVCNSTKQCHYIYSQRRNWLPRPGPTPLLPGAWLRHCLHVQGRGGVLQPGVPAAAHNARGVEGQVHVKVYEQGGGAGDQSRPLRQDRHRRHGGGGLT